MKRSTQIRLLLLGGLTTGAFTACGPSRSGGVAHGLRPDSVYGNDHQVPIVGHYYHAPYRGWYPLPYNHFDAKKKMYFHGGNWTSVPHESVVNLSEPRPEALQTVLALWQQQQQHRSIQRSGFGSTSRSFFTSS